MQVKGLYDTNEMLMVAVMVSLKIGQTRQMESDLRSTSSTLHPYP